MAKKLTATQLIEYYCDKIDDEDRGNMEVEHGNEPSYPMLVLFFGEDAMSGYDDVSRNLCRIWPSYEGELRFIGVRKENDTPTFVVLDSSDKRTLTSEEVEQIMDSLAESSNHFRNHSRQLLYYILDTSSIGSCKELYEWINLADSIKHELNVYEDEILQMFFVLLNESSPKRAVAAHLRNALSEYCKGARRACHRFVLLSNRQSGNNYTSRWDTCYRICSSFIALSNNDDANVASILFAPGVVTASYVCERKPIRDIGQVVVEQLVEYLANNDDSSCVVGFDGNELQSKLGLTDDGTLRLLDEFANELIDKELPKSEEINLLPRWNDKEYGDISRFTARELDNFTMDTWSAYLEHIVTEIRERVRVDSTLRNVLTKEYRHMLNEEFSPEELIYLVNHSEEVRHIFMNVREPSPDNSALEFAKRKLRAMITADDAIVDLCVDSIIKQASFASELQCAWNEFCMSKSNLHRVHDDSIVNYYSSQMKNHFNRKGHYLRKGFRDIDSLEGLRKYLFNAIDETIEGSSIFTAPYEVELEARLRRNAQTHNARQYIRERLTGDNALIYLRVNSSLSDVLLTAVLLKGNTELSRNLKTDLLPATYYYDTGYGNAVEVLSVLEVRPWNLLNEEGR